MSYKWQAPSRHGVDGRKAGKCVSLITGQPVTRAQLKAQAASRTPSDQPEK